MNIPYFLSHVCLILLRHSKEKTGADHPWDLKVNPYFKFVWFFFSLFCFSFMLRVRVTKLTLNGSAGTTIPKAVY